MKDYYKTLGIDKSASKDEVKKAFRKLAHEFHPDKTKNDPAASAKFKEASEAYSVLSDDNKRKQYDMYGSAGPGFNPGGGQGGFNGAQGFGGFDFSQFQQGSGFQFNQGGMEFDLGDIFGEFFGGGRRPRKGRSINVDVQLTFRESIFGVEKEISIDDSLQERSTGSSNRPGGKEKLLVKIPPGIETGQGLRVGGKGEEGAGGRGDLIVRVWVKEDHTFRKEGFNLVMDLPVKLTTALVGATVEIESLDGRLEVKIPAGTSHGEILRIKGKGVPYETRGTWSGQGKRGDLLIITHVSMPKKLSKEAQRLIEELKNQGL